VQKDAQYGPSFGNNGGGENGLAKGGSTPGKGGGGQQWGPPWMRGGGWWGNGGAPWAAWGNFAGSSTGPTPEDDLRNKLRYCPPPVHQVGSFREQYFGQTYCYKCTRLDCDNRQVNMGSADQKMELACWKLGNVVDSDP
jgi:hypothetical protein